MKSVIAYSLAGVMLLSHCARAAESLKLSARIEMPGVHGRIDHMAYDSKRGHLFVAALGSDKVVVVDTHKESVISEISDVREPQGIAYLPDLDKVVVASGEGATVDFYDASSFKREKRLNGFDDADNVRYDQATATVYVGYGSGGLAAFNAKTQTLTDKVKLPAHPESFQLEPKGSRIFINLPGAGMVAVVDRTNGAVIKQWRISARNNYPMALDADAEQLLIGCRTPACILRLDAKSGKQLQSVVTAGDADDLFINHETHRAYESCGQGVIDQFTLAPTGAMEKSNTVATRAGARTSLFVPSAHTLFLAAREHAGKPAEIQVYAAD